MLHLSEFCCICLSKNIVLSVLEDDHFKLLVYCVPELVFDNNFSLYICEKCNKQLIEMSAFKRTCIISHSVIAGYVTQLQNADITGNKSANFFVDLACSSNNKLIITHENELVNHSQQLDQAVNKELLTDEYLSVNSIQDEATTSVRQKISIKTESVMDDEEITLEATSSGSGINEDLTCNNDNKFVITHEDELDDHSQQLVQPVKEEFKEELMLTDEYLSVKAIQDEASSSVRQEIIIKTESVVDDEQITLESTPSGSATNEQPASRLDDIVFVDMKDIKTEQMWEDNEEIEHDELLSSIEIKEGAKFQLLPQKNVHIHDEKDDQKKQYKCQQCDKCFSRPSRLTIHMREHTGEKPYSCQICGKSFSQSYNLHRHETIHSDERKYKCDLCTKSYIQPSNLLLHKRTHTGEKPYICDTCGKAFSAECTLKKHQTVHTGERKFKCEFCGKGCRQLHDLQKHRRIHTGERPYKCDICGKAFIISSSLIEHQITHTGQKEYECDVCNTKFTASRSLKRHKKKCPHQITLIAQKEYECEVCNKKFSALRSMKRHKQNFHS